MSDLRRLHFVVRQLGGFKEEAWAGADAVDGSGPARDLSQELFSRLGDKEPWWKSLYSYAFLGGEPQPQAATVADDVDARREFGLGLWGRLTSREFKDQHELPYPVWPLLIDDD